MSTLVEFTGPARLDRRTKRLVHRLTEDDVAIVDHVDLDRVTAEELLETGVRVVVNVSESLSGRYPNPGPLLLVRGGVTLIDAPGAELFDVVADGEPLTVRGASVFRNGTCLARGRARDEHELVRALAEQRGRVTDSLSEFAENTLQHLKARRVTARRGNRLPADEDAVPRPACARGRARAGLQGRPADRCGPTSATSSRCSIAVDGGADALLDAGYTPDVIVGDMDSVSDDALRSGAELLVHAYHGNGNAPGAARAESARTALPRRPGDGYQRGRGDAARP